MLNTQAQCDPPQPPPAVRLRCIWHVDADASYDIQRRPGTAAGRLLCVRTVAGYGLLDLAGQERRAEAGSVLLFDQGLLGRYRCPGRAWHFWWFDCEQAPADAAIHELRHPWSPQEEADHRRAYRALQRPDAAEHVLASALLAAWICRWRAAAPARTGTPHQAAVDAVIDAIHERLDGALTQSDLCRIAGLGERHLRSCFRARTGSSPKRFYLDLRLAHAREVLLQEPRPLADLAEELGFSSAFHLSRAFAQRYDHPPSGTRL
ncbi:MAG: helix-turn-helix domain-containing protein [Planctomycetota bacterium]